MSANDRKGSDSARAAPAPAAGAAGEPAVPRFSIEYLDRAVEPSADFYRFAVGNWIDHNPVPADRSRWSGFDELDRRNYELLRRILDEAAAAPAGPDEVLRRVGDFYASALDTPRIEARGLGPIERRLAQLGAIREAAAIPPALAALHRSGVPGLFVAGVAADRRNSSVYALYLYQGGLSLPDRDYYLRENFAEIREKYRVHLAASFALLGEAPALAQTAAEAVFALERELAEAGRARAELREAEKNYHRFTPAELASRYPHLSWPEYLGARGAGSVEYVVVGQPEFFDALDALLRRKPASELATYLRWQLYRHSAPFLHAAAEEADFAFFHRVLLGQQEPEPRWKRAARLIDAEIGEALGRLYVERHFPPEARRRMLELVEDLRAVFTARLGGLEWMTPETRARALAKFERFTTKIGHPEQYRDYSSIRIHREDLVGNVARAEEFESDRQFGRIAGPVDRSEWGMTPPMVNAYFNPSQNEIVFPAGILQPPFFDVTADDAVNYGAIGTVIGHEITHGYDDQGRKYDAEGNLNDWWSAADATEFDARAHRVELEYNGYAPLPGEFVNGRLTLGENIADLGGLRLAYQALQRRLALEPARRRTVDGFTPEQRFFLAYAQIWRSTCRDEEARRRLAIDPHSPPAFRVRGAVLNMGEFAEAFSIPEGRPMFRSPTDRITIW